MCDFVSYLKAINLNDYTLIIPSVSVGNVGQLTVDLLISSYNLKKVATFWHPAIIASVGSDPFTKDSAELCTACELYANEDLKLATIQIRSSIVFKLALSFFEELKAFVVENRFKNVTILTSSFAYLLVDVHQIYHYLSNDEQSNLNQIGFKLLQPGPSGRYVVEGSGYGLKLYEILKDVVQCTVLIKYVSEGDNRQDANTVMNKLQNFEPCLKDDVTLKYPSSWDYVFGNPSPLEIF